MEEKDNETIGMLLDIDHLYGEHEGRLAPFLYCAGIIVAPILVYIYIGAYTFFPIYLFVPIMIVIAVRAIMIIPGREKYRVEKFKKRLFDDYMNSAELMNIKTIHPDGCIEFLNSQITYLVCCFNGTSDNEIQRSVQLRKLLESMIGDFEWDTYITNVTDSPALREYYQKVSSFEKNKAAENFIRIIDHNLELAEETSLVQCTVYAIRGYRSDWKEIKHQIDIAVNSRVARCYKTIYRVDDQDAINELLNRNADTVVNISDLLRRKYTDQRYGTSKVLAYDLPENKEIIQGSSKIKPVLDTPPKHGFHVKYEDVVKEETHVKLN